MTVPQSSPSIGCMSWQCVLLRPVLYQSATFDRMSAERIKTFVSARLTAEERKGFPCRQHTIGEILSSSTMLTSTTSSRSPKPRRGNLEVECSRGLRTFCEASYSHPIAGGASVCFNGRCDMQAMLFLSCQRSSFQFCWSCRFAFHASLANH